MSKFAVRATMLHRDLGRYVVAKERPHVSIQNLLIVLLGVFIFERCQEVVEQFIHFDLARIS